MTAAIRSPFARRTLRRREFGTIVAMTERIPNADRDKPTEMNPDEA